MRVGLIAGLMGAGTALSGCYMDPEHEHYLRRADTVTLSAGEAVAYNKAVHTIDPWPRHSRNAQIDMDGRRGLLAIRRYQADEVKEPATLEVEPFAGAPTVGGGGGVRGGGGNNQ